MSTTKELREAFVAGVKYGTSHNPNCAVEWSQKLALVKYPQPTRPRAVSYDGWDYRIVDGFLEVRTSGAQFARQVYSSAFPVADSAYLRLIADLKDNPTEPDPDA